MDRHVVKRRMRPTVTASQMTTAPGGQWLTGVRRCMVCNWCYLRYPNILTAFARSTSPRNSASTTTSAQDRKKAPLRRAVHMCLPRERRGGQRCAVRRMTGMGEVKTSNDAGFTRSQPYGLGAGLERSSPVNHVSASMPNNTAPALHASKNLHAGIISNDQSRGACASGCSTFSSRWPRGCTGWFASAPLGVCPDCMSLHQPECFPVGIRVHGN